MNRVVTRLGMTTFALVAGALPVMAQGTQTGNMTIDVVDTSGAPMAGVTIRLSSPSLQGVRTGVTDAKGRMAARLLPPGNYSIELIKEGFQTAKSTATIGIDQNYQPRFTMQQTASAVVVVAAASAAVDKTDVKTASNYSMDKVDMLPNGRTMEAVALLTPGVTSGVGGRVQVRGAQTSANLYLVDGQNVSDNAYNNRGVLLIDDAIEETQVLTGGISAEYGNLEGGVLNSITKSGGNTFTGSLRWDLTNPAWNALQPFQNRAAVDNKLSEFKSATLGGYIIKDRLWFFGAYYTTDSSGVGTISGNARPGPDAAGANFTTTLKEIRRTFKLTYAINENHTLVASFANSQNAQGNRNYSAGELSALDDQTNKSEFANFAWRSVWNPSLTTEVRYGYKKQVLSAGAKDPSLSPIYDYTTRFYYNNGIFNKNDGGDNRDNKTANLKGTYFLNAAGQHQFDFGLDWIEGSAKARNEQSPTNMIFGTLGFSVPNRTARGIDVWMYESAVGVAKNTATGVYFNDKWQIDSHLALQLGVRFDKYEAKKEDGTVSAGANGLSPRLGLKYDLFGDQQWIFGLSWARYNGKVLDTITNSVTNQGNPTEIDHPYIGPAGNQPFSVIYDLANYDLTTISYYNNPALNVKLNKSMKAPSVDEIQGSAAYSFSTELFGQGFASLTAVQKKWNNLIDYSVGENGTVDDPTGATHEITKWDNSSIAERKYQGLELQVQLTKGAWNIGGNISWSKLEGNYEGEGTNTPGRGEGLQNYTSYHGVVMYDRNITAPYGYLAGHQPLSMRWTGSHTSANALGKLNVGLVYRFNSGSHYSDTRTLIQDLNNGTGQLNPALTATEFGTSATQYRDNKRGQYVFNGNSSLDLALTEDFELFKVGSTPVNAFFKLVITNVLNHQQLITWNTVSNSPIGADNSYGEDWVRGASYGTSRSATNYGAARGITVSTGFRF